MTEQESTRKKGRPKVTDREIKSKSYTLKIKQSTFTELNRICGLRQFETGKRSSVSDLVNNILDEYVAIHRTQEN